MTCASCGEATAATEFGATGELCDTLCLNHLRQLRRARNAKARREALELAKVTCRSCGEPGVLYPSGVWCKSCLPPLDDSFSVKSSPRGTVIKKTDEESEPMLRAVKCPDDKLPSTLRAALKSAEANGWEYYVTIAIDADGLTSILARFAHQAGHHMSTRHEQQEGKPMGFKAGWFQTTPTAFPVRIGWREVTAALKGALDEKVYDDRAALLAGMELVMDKFDANVLRVERND